MRKSLKEGMQRKGIVRFERIEKFLLDLFEKDVHSKRVLSITNGVLGVINHQ